MVIAANGANKVLETMNGESHIRVAVVGNVDSGKSTLIGTLKSSILDDGRGSSRSRIAKHKHELVTGRTSSVSEHAIGFDEDGNVLSKCAGLSEIARTAARVVTMIDLAGHEKYLKTTVSGLSMGMVDYALVLVNSSQPSSPMTMHHLKLCSGCGIPVIVVMTKADTCPSHVYQHTRNMIVEKLRGSDIGKRQFVIKNDNDVETVKDKVHTLAPIVTISSVTGEGLDLLKKLLVALPKRRRHETKSQRPFEFLIEDVFNVTGVGAVLSGFVNAGECKKGDDVYVGPLSNGSFLKAMIRSAHVAQTDVDRVWAGHSACFTLSLSKGQRSLIKKGMVVVQDYSKATAIRTFKANITILRGVNSTMTTGRYSATAHILHIKKSVKLIGIDDHLSYDRFGGALAQHKSSAVARPGDRAIITMQFSGGPAYVRKGMRVILRDGHVRAIGVITETRP